jgi:hypothetical protein
MSQSSRNPYSVAAVVTRLASGVTAAATTKPKPFDRLTVYLKVLGYRTHRK